MKHFIYALLIMTTLVPAVSAVTYTVNPDMSEVKWTAAKVSGKHIGQMKVVSGTVEMEAGALKGGEAVIDMNSIRVDDIQDPKGNKKLTGHLKSQDFFDVANHPTAAVKVTDVKQGPEAGTFEVTADVTVKGITKPAAFIAKVVEIPEGVRAIAKIVLDRTDYGVRYGSGKFFENLGDTMINDKFELDVSIPATKETAGVSNAAL